MHERTKNTLLALAVALLLLAVVGTIGWQWWGLLSGDWQLPRSEEEAWGVATGSGGFGKRALRWRRNLRMPMRMRLSTLLLWPLRPSKAIGGSSIVDDNDKLTDAAYTSARATVDAGDKIAAAIDRNTEAVERQTTWLQLPEEDPLLDVAKDIRDWHRVIFIFIVVATIVLLVAISSAKAAPLVSDGDEIASLGTEVRQ